MSIKVNFLSVKQRVDQINPKATLVCVSKTKPIEDLLEAYEAGNRIFGENYIQELVEKADKIPDAEFHFIGQIQQNKIAKLVKIPNLTMIQSISSEAVAFKINSLLSQSRTLDILIQVNTSEEKSKSGVSVGEVTNLVKFIQENCPKLKFRGLMTIGEIGESRRDFQVLIDERRRVSQDIGVDESNLELSMGMSADFELALECGATIVRVGSSIFGSRH